MEISDDFFIVTFLNMVLSSIGYRKHQNRKALESKHVEVPVFNVTFLGALWTYDEIKSPSKYTAMTNLAQGQGLTRYIKDRYGNIGYKVATKKGLSFVIDHLIRLMLPKSDEEAIAQILAGDREIIDYFLTHYEDACQMLFEARRKGRI